MSAHPAASFRYDNSTVLLVYTRFPYLCLIQNVHVDYTDQLSVQVDHESYLRCDFALNAFGCIILINLLHKAHPSEFLKFIPVVVLEAKMLQI